MLTRPKVVKVSEVNALPIENAQNTWVRVLISTSEAPTYAMRFFEMDLNGHIDAHSHPWEHEIFVLEGKVKIRVESDIYDLDTYTAIYIPPDKVHEYWNIGNTKAKFLCIIPIKPTSIE